MISAFEFSISIATPVSFIPFMNPQYVSDFTFTMCIQCSGSFLLIFAGYWFFLVVVVAVDLICVCFCFLFAVILRKPFKNQSFVKFSVFLCEPNTFKDLIKEVAIVPFYGYKITRGEVYIHVYVCMYVKGPQSNVFFN